MAGTDRGELALAASPLNARFVAALYWMGAVSAFLCIMAGRYAEVRRPSRLVYTQTFEPMRAMGEATVTVTFDEREGWTRVVSKELYPSKAVRDAALSSGMEHGMRESMEQLDALVESLR